MLKESKADIFVDPVLHTACALDIKHHCAAITPGRGRRKSLYTLTLSELSWEEQRLPPETLGAATLFYSCSSTTDDILWELCGKMNFGINLQFEWT